MSKPRKPKLPAPASASAPVSARRETANALRQSVRYVLSGVSSGSLAGGPDAPAPADIGVFRLVVARRIETLLGTPRRCPAPICRRSKVCADDAMRCQRDVARPPMTPEREARALAHVQHALKRALAERAANQP